MTRTPEMIRKDLTEARSYESMLRYGSPEYKANRQVIGALVKELAAEQDARLNLSGAFSPADYQSYPDSFEQMAKNREREQSAPQLSKETVAA